MNKDQSQMPDDRELEERINRFFQPRLKAGENFVGRTMALIAMERARRLRRRGYWISAAGLAGAAAAMVMALRVFFPSADAPSPHLAGDPWLTDAALAQDMEDLFTSAAFYSEALHLEKLLADAGEVLDENHVQTLEILAYFAGF